MTTPIMVPAKPEEKHFDFLFGMIANFRQLAIVTRGYYFEGSDWMPFVNIDSNGEWRAFQFKSSNQKNTILEIPALLQAAYIPSSLLSCEVYLASLRASVKTDDWRECLAAYFDFLAAWQAEEIAKDAGEKEKHFLILDQFDANENRVERRLIGSYATRLAAKYALRQYSGFQVFTWNYRSLRNIWWESAFSKQFDVVEDFADPDQVQVRLTTSYPYSRGRRKPFTTVWRWHLSRQVPLVEAGTMPPEEADGERHERWTHRPGDPKILRETGTGLFGSFPSFEGDDEPEYQDER